MPDHDAGKLGVLKVPLVPPQEYEFDLEVKEEEEAPEAMEQD